MYNKNCIIYIFGVFLFFQIFSSCEVNIDKIDSSLYQDSFVLNSIASTDTNLRVSLSKSYLFSHLPLLSASSFYKYETQLYPYDEKFYKSNAIVSYARVTATINNSQTIILDYNPESCEYESDYFPKEGDSIELEAESDSFYVAKAVTKIPDKTLFRVDEYSKIYSYNDKSALVNMGIVDFTGSDSMAIIKITIIPNNIKGTQYYRLRVNSISSIYSSDESKENDEPIGYYRSDIFYSDDLIFRDESLKESYGGYPAYFSNVFTNALFGRNEYTFTIQTRLRFSDEKRVIVELQTISSSLYHYLKSTMRYRVSSVDMYTEPVQIPSNVENGWGVFGGANSTKTVLSF